jgi:tRNA (guanine37-N1)-methyltransferase
VLTINVVTIFPEFFRTPLSLSIPARAAAAGGVQYRLLDLRTFTHDKHRSVDDYPFGGGPGMVMAPGPFFEAVESVGATAPIVLLSPRGRRFGHADAVRFAAGAELTLLCGHYKDVDERVAQHLATEELSLGDFVLSGGEPAALAIIDATVRLLPGAMSDLESARTDSFFDRGISAPSYTRPPEYRGHTVPEVLWHRQAAPLRRPCLAAGQGGSAQRSSLPTSWPELIRQAKERIPALGAELEREYRTLAGRRAFGLNFERHRPRPSSCLAGRCGAATRSGCCRPAVRPIAATTACGGSPESRRSDQRLAHLEPLGADETDVVPADDLVVVAEFRDPIYPGLCRPASVERGGDKPFHTVINARTSTPEGAHLHPRGQGRRIYIDPPYNTGLGTGSTTTTTSRATTLPPQQVARLHGAPPEAGEGAAQPRRLGAHRHHRREGVPAARPAAGADVPEADIQMVRFPVPQVALRRRGRLRFFVSDKPDAVVLDFFAGSGTTAHAVMRLNKQDGGRRQCIW